MMKTDVSSTMDAFDVFDDPAPAAAAAAYTQPTLLPLVRSFAQQHVHSISSALCAAGRDDLARALDDAAALREDAAPRACAVSEGCWNALQVGDSASCVREAYSLAQLLLAGLAATPRDALEHVDRAFILGGTNAVLHECIVHIEGELLSASTAARPRRTSTDPTVDDLLVDAGLQPSAAHALPVLSEVSIDAFQSFYRSNRPVVLQNGMLGWRALDRW